ncbi:MAG: hypothetical protein ACK41X_05505 [Pseudorhodoplanes sp.]
MFDLCVAASNQDIRHRDAELRARRNGQKMRIAFAVADRDQVAIHQTWRLRQDRPGDRDFVIEGQPADYGCRRIADGREHFAQSDQRAQFNALDQVHQHVVEKLNLLLSKGVGAFKEQVSNPKSNIASSPGIPVVE